MKKKWLIFLAAVTALGITACGSGDGIVINGTTAAEAGSDQLEGGSEADGETTSRAKIEIITGETAASSAAAQESAAQPVQTQAAQTQAQTQPATTAAPRTESATKAAAETTAKAAAETTAAKKYKVTDIKKTMYATASVRVRASYSTSSDVMAALAEGEKVEVTGKVENGWMRVRYKDITGYVSGSYLTETPPATKSSAQTSAAQTGSSQKPTTTTGTGTTPGGSAGTGSPAAGNSAGNAAQPGNAGSSPSGTNSGAASPGGSTAPGGGSSSGGKSVSGTVVALDPSGVTVQAGDGTSYQFTWGSSTPDLVEGDRVNISYETGSSGEKKITGVSK